MKKLNTKSVILLIALLLFPFQSNAQKIERAPIESEELPCITFWNKLIPRYIKGQFAGSIGMLSAGVGWNYGKGHWETDMLLGYIPKNTDRHAMATFTLKQNYIPWKVPLSNRFDFEPLSCGLFLNTLFDDDFWVKNPEKYPKGYYSFSTKVRIHVFVSERFTYKFKRQDMFAKSISFFYELSTSDLYLINAINNSYLKPKDYLSLAFGIKLQIF
ncbi:hypothetical protein [Massilibacteroides sp.]|uniref:hypothetical protein n=1 Tax=Massilibacteroides sp. TaxID=2034766 RepID=UPI00261A8346|nr:hypothetical protein [Massilibacteroides sp.]MDD4514372.1 hypothetical protein [Massilibacteroides sp.]